MNQKVTFKRLLAVLSILLAVLPFLVTFSAFLTSIFNKIGWYVVLQKHVVPYEARFVAVLLRLVKIKGIITPSAHFAMVLERPTGEYLPIDLQWNCLGWQSIVMLGLTLVTGLRGNWTLRTKFEVVVFGILGTFLVNIFRMALITTLAYYVNEVAAHITHDYFAAFVALIWLIFYWWFSYSYILEPEQISIKK